MEPTDRCVRFFASGFCSGLLPLIPGTFGSAVACAMLFALYKLVPAASGLTFGIALTAVTTVFAIVFTDAALDRKIFGDGKDPRPIVIDEFAGCCAAVTAVQGSLVYFVAAFFLFRLFDITKPPPVSTLERIPRGSGVVLDDVMAGVYANIVLQILILFGLSA